MPSHTQYSRIICARRVHERSRVKMGVVRARVHMDPAYAAETRMGAVYTSLRLRNSQSVDFDWRQAGTSGVSNHRFRRRQQCWPERPNPYGGHRCARKKSIKTPPDQRSLPHLQPNKRSDFYHPIVWSVANPPPIWKENGDRRWCSWCPGQREQPRDRSSCSLCCWWAQQERGTFPFLKSFWLS